MSAPGHHSWCKSTLRAEIASCCQSEMVAAEQAVEAWYESPGDVTYPAPERVEVIDTLESP